MLSKILKKYKFCDRDTPVERPVDESYRTVKESSAYENMTWLQYLEKEIRPGQHNLARFWRQTKCQDELHHNLYKKAFRNLALVDVEIQELRKSGSKRTTGLYTKQIKKMFYDKLRGVK